MRRIDIINSTTKLSTLFQGLNLWDVYRNLQGPISDKSARRSITPEVYELHKRYAVAESRFTQTDRDILKIFGVEPLSDSGIWASLVTDDGAGNRAIRDIFYGTYQLAEFLPKMVELLKQDNVTYKSGVSTTITEISPEANQALLSLILPESGKQISSVERVINLLQSITDIHEFVVLMNKYEHVKLSVAAIDSGSDKSFDLVGLAKAVNAIKEILFGIWDRVVLHREKKSEARVELVLKTLPALAMIHDYRAKGKITGEEAARMQNILETGVEKFLKSGAILNEFHGVATYEPRQIMSAEPKQIGLQHDEEDEEKEPNQITAIKKEEVAGEDLGFTPKQMDAIKRMLEQQNSTDTETAKSPTRTRKPRKPEEE